MIYRRGGHRRCSRLAVVVILSVTAAAAVGCSRGESGGARGDRAAGGSPSLVLGEGEGIDTSAPVLPEGICVLDDQLVDRLLEGQEADPVISSRRGEQIFFEDLINLNTMILGELSTCVWDPPRVTTHVASYVAWAPGDQLTSPVELGTRMFDRLLVPFTSQDGTPPMVEATIRQVSGLGDAAVLVRSSVGSISWLMSRSGGLLVAVATVADTPDEEALRAAVEELLATAQDAVARSGGSAALPGAVAGSGAGQDQQDQPVSGELVSSGDLTGSWAFRPGGAFSCGSTVEIPLISTDASAMGYLEVEPDGSARFGSGVLGPSALRGQVALTHGARNDGELRIDVDGSFTGSDGTVSLTGALTVRCP
ncbi:MAG: hypothetical protein N2037_06015 [Acidimicrobiales bacterium]|nr:hypothetical protein [Acidimicrobiales bacterium]